MPLQRSLGFPLMNSDHSSSGWREPWLPGGMELGVPLPTSLLPPPRALHSPGAASRLLVSVICQRTSVVPSCKGWKRTTLPVWPICFPGEDTEAQRG